ncbi:MAG: proprotein convertase P-domain-containing protein [Marinicellaceae bacterium]
MKIKPIIIFIICVMSCSSALAKKQPIVLLDNPNFDAFHFQDKSIQKGIKTTSHEVKASGIFPVDIPDNDPTGITIEIEASSFTGTIESLTFELEIEHTYVGDLSATLTAPNGIAKLVLFSRVGRAPGSNNGYGANLIGTYAFNDQSTNDIWTTSLENDVANGINSILPTGLYRTSTSGTNLSRFGGCTTRLNGAFKGLTADQANGTWTLNISDNEGGDVGQVLSVGLLTDQDNSNVDSIFRSSFEVEYANLQLLPASDTLGDCKKAQFDFSGNGLSDYVISYGSENEQLVFIYFFNTGNGTSSGFNVFNIAPTALNPVLTSGGDFDGDGITDAVVRVDNPDGFYDYLIRRSSRPNDKWISISTSLDFYDPQFGDYDGDGLDDLAWFIASENVVNNSIFFIFNSSDFSQRQLTTGMGMRSDIRAAGGFDHSGDGIADLFLMVDDGMETGDQIAKIYDGTDGNLILDSVTAAFSSITRQLPGYFLNGDRAGLGIFALDIPGSDNYFFAVRDDNDATLPGLISVVFGNDPTDTPVTGDYDGDGIDDFGVWRPDTDGMGARFIIRPSGSADPDNNLIEISPMGAVGADVPLGNIRVR